MGWDLTTDLLIVGSGAGAMTAAIRASDLGAQSLILEKSEHYGGSSAMSGGGLWIPDNHCMRALGIDDSAEEAGEYLKFVSQGAVSEERLKRYSQQAREVMQYLVERTPLELTAVRGYCDYYPDAPGAKRSGRTLEPRPFNADELGEDRCGLRPLHPQMLALGRIPLTITEAQRAIQPGMDGGLLVLRRLAAYCLDLPSRIRRRSSRRLTMGNALVGCLRVSLRDRSVPLRPRTHVTRLISRDGRVVGVEARDSRGTLRIEGRRGVLLAAGGFDRDSELRRRFGHPPRSTDGSAGNLANGGDAIRMGLEIGADLDLMHAAWWTPVLRVPGESIAWLAVYAKGLPGTIFVDRTGSRFTNEAAPYGDVALGIQRVHAAGRGPTHMIFDRKFRRRYPLGHLQPSLIMADSAIPADWMGRFIHRGGSVRELAISIGVDGDKLAESVERINRFAREGTDRDFGRGSGLYDRCHGIHSVRPNPSLGPLDRPPFYAVAVESGDLGTCGGLRTDSDARVLDGEGSPIEGLYATGNCAASIMGGSCAGAGSTLGPSMTFGFLAAEDAVVGSGRAIRAGTGLRIESALPDHSPQASNRR